jgi:hypothetical protein
MNFLAPKICGQLRKQQTPHGKAARRYIKRERIVAGAGARLAFPENLLRYNFVVYADDSSRAISARMESSSG